MKYLIAFSILFYIPHSTTALHHCHQVFSRKKQDMFSNISHHIHNPLSKTLIESYRSSYELKFFESKRQARQFEKGLKQFISFLERNPTPNEQVILSNLNTPMDALVQKTSEIIEFTQKTSKTESLYFKKITLAVLSIFSKHLPALLQQDISQVDWARIQLITKQIADFNPHDPAFSMYKIKRAIEGRYSLKEFILCRS